MFSNGSPTQEAWLDMQFTMNRFLMLTQNPEPGLITWQSALVTERQKVLAAMDRWKDALDAEVRKPAREPTP